MKRARSTLWILTALVSLIGWLAISNHCVLGASVKPETKPAADECPFHAKPSAPAKQKRSSDSPCCKILRAVPAKSLTNAIVDLAHVDLSFAESFAVAPPTIFFGSATLDTGPPGKTSFAELIRSMRAHAPPSLA